MTHLLAHAKGAPFANASLLSVDEATGVVTVELMGACVTCPASTQTLKAGIERIMKDRVEGVTEVLEVNALGMSESPVQL